MESEQFKEGLALSEKRFNNSEDYYMMNAVPVIFYEIGKKELDLNLITCAILDKKNNDLKICFNGCHIGQIINFEGVYTRILIHYLHFKPTCVRTREGNVEKLFLKRRFCLTKRSDRKLLSRVLFRCRYNPACTWMDLYKQII